MVSFSQHSQNNYELYPSGDLQWNVLTWYQTFHLNLFIYPSLLSWYPRWPISLSDFHISGLRYTSILLCVTLLWLCLLMWSTCWAVRLSALSFRVSSGTNNDQITIQRHIKLLYRGQHDNNSLSLLFIPNTEHITEKLTYHPMTLLSYVRDFNFFSQKHRRAAPQYIKKKKGGKKSLQYTKLQIGGSVATLNKAS